jgi:hypothetical protein
VIEITPVGSVRQDDLMAMRAFIWQICVMGFEFVPKSILPIEKNPIKIA